MVSYATSNTHSADISPQIYCFSLLSFVFTIFMALLSFLYRLCITFVENVIFLLIWLFFQCIFCGNFLSRFPFFFAFFVAIYRPCCGFSSPYFPLFGHFLVFIWCLVFCNFFYNCWSFFLLFFGFFFFFIFCFFFFIFSIFYDFFELFLVLLSPFS